MDAHADAGVELLRQRLSGGLPPRLHDALRLFVRATIDNHRDNPRLHRVLFEEAPRAPAFLAHLHVLEELAVDTTAQLLEQHPDVQADSRLNAHIVVATIESLVHRLVTSPTPVDFQQLEDEIVLMLTGYLPAHTAQTILSPRLHRTTPWEANPVHSTQTLDGSENSKVSSGSFSTSCS